MHWLHRLKWRLILLLGIYEFSVDCECGNRIRIIDGVRDYEYICGKCDKQYIGTKRVFS